MSVRTLSGLDRIFEMCEDIIDYCAGTRRKRSYARTIFLAIRSEARLDTPCYTRHVIKSKKDCGMDYGIAGKVALVTASSSGLGKAAAHALAAEGANVVLFSRTAEVLRAAAAE